MAGFQDVSLLLFQPTTPFSQPSMRLPQVTTYRGEGGHLEAACEKNKGLDGNKRDPANLKAPQSLPQVLASRCLHMKTSHICVQKPRLWSPRLTNSSHQPSRSWLDVAVCGSLFSIRLTSHPGPLVLDGQATFGHR